LEACLRLSPNAGLTNFSDENVPLKKVTFKKYSREQILSLAVKKGPLRIPAYLIVW
jgi:hypothetical protein